MKITLDYEKMLLTFEGEVSISELTDKIHTLGLEHWSIQGKAVEVRPAMTTGTVTYNTPPIGSIT